MLGTRGIHFYPDYEIPINYYENAEQLYLTNQYNCYRLIFIEKGIGSMSVNEDRIAILPLTCLCLNEKDQIKDFDITGLKLQLICVLPSAINSRLSLEKVNSNEGLTVSDTQDKQFILPFIRRSNTSVNYIIFSMDTGKRVLEILLELKDLLLIQNDSWPCLTRSYLIELLFLVERTFNCTKTATERAEVKSGFSAELLLPYIHNNYMDRLTIGDLTKRFNTNRTTLSKEFKKATGYSVIDYVIKTRIEVAAGMLRDTAMKIELIVERVGFHNVTHFNKVFKEYMKCLPSEYRKMYSAY